MRSIKRRIAELLLLALLLSATGCGAMRRPGPTPAPDPPPSFQHGPKQEGSVAYPTPRAGSAYDDPSTGVAIIASSVPGAGPISAVVMGNVTLLGISSQDGTVIRKVAEQIHASFPHIVEVRTTADPAAINRLAQISERIRAQQTIAPFLTELAGLSERMTPVR